MARKAKKVPTKKKPITRRKRGPNKNKAIPERMASQAPALGSLFGALGEMARAKQNAADYNTTISTDARGSVLQALAHVMVTQNEAIKAIAQAASLAPNYTETESKTVA